MKDTNFSAEIAAVAAKLTVAEEAAQRGHREAAQQALAEAKIRTQRILEELEQQAAKTSRDADV